jgi:hypothetical protein
MEYLKEVKEQCGSCDYLNRNETSGKEWRRK